MDSRKLIVFDMDGVLVDVSASYRDVVRETVYLFFKGAKGFESLPHPLFSLGDLGIVKSSGGLNNDWELTYLVISLLLEYAEIENSLYERIKAYSKVPRENLLREYLRSIDVCSLGKYLRDKEMPLANMYNGWKEKREALNPIVRFFSDGDVESGNVIKRIFQEVYLGGSLFVEVYGFKPRFYSGEGFINREFLIIDKPTLEWLSRQHVLAVATGRPRVEAEYALRRFGIERYFSEVLTLDDCLEEEERILKERGKRPSLSKPHPYMLDRIASEFKEICNSYYLIGDMPDDMICARSSSFDYVGIGFVAKKGSGTGNEGWTRGIAKNLEHHGAKKVFFSVEELKIFFENF